MHRLVMVGGGHAQLSVLKVLVTRRSADVEAVLVTPSAHQTYSGMLPGWMAGHYSLSDCMIDLRPLAEAAGVRLVMDSVVVLTRHSGALSSLEALLLSTIVCLWMWVVKRIARGWRRPGVVCCQLSR